MLLGHVLVRCGHSSYCKPLILGRRKQQIQQHTSYKEYIFEASLDSIAYKYVHECCQLGLRCVLQRT